MSPPKKAEQKNEELEGDSDGTIQHAGDSKYDWEKWYEDDVDEQDEVQQASEALEDEGDFDGIIQHQDEGDLEEGDEGDEFVPIEELASRGRAQQAYTSKPAIDTVEAAIAKINTAEGSLPLNLKFKGIDVSSLNQAIRLARFPLSLTSADRNLGTSDLYRVLTAIRGAQVPLTLVLRDKDIGNRKVGF